MRHCCGANSFAFHFVHDSDRKASGFCARLVPSNTCIMRTGKTRGLHGFLHVTWNDGVSRLESAAPQGMEEIDSERGARSHPLPGIKCSRWCAMRTSTRRSCAPATWIASSRRASSQLIGCSENRRARRMTFVDSYEISHTLYEIIETTYKQIAYYVVKRVYC